MSVKASNERQKVEFFNKLAIFLLLSTRKC